MAFAVPFALGGKVDLQIPIARFIAQIVMPHQTVKVERRPGASMALHRDDFFDRLQRRGDLRQHAVGFLNRRAARHIKDHGKLGFIVKGQQFDRHRFGVKQPHRQDGRRRHRQKKPRRIAT